MKRALLVAAVVAGLAAVRVALLWRRCTVPTWEPLP